MSNREVREPMSWGEIAGFALLGLVVVLLVRSSRSANSNLVPTGTPFPAIMAEGWLNADQAPYDGRVSVEDLQDKVVVVDCWATWCPPCRAAMPELTELYAKYQPLGVEFIGLTPESEQERGTIAKFIESVDGFDWPVAYGTMPMQDMLGIRGWPTVIVFGANGTAVWSSNRLIGIEEVLDQALATAARE